MSLRWIKEVGHRLKALLRGGKLSRDLNTELEQHLEFMVTDNIAKGMSPAEARRAARVQFGSVEKCREETRDSWGARLVQDILHDIRYSSRQLNKARGFALIAILTLAIGIGATTAIFSIFNSVVLRPLDYVDSHELVELRRVRVGTEERQFLRLAELQEWQQQATSYSELAAYAYLSGNMTDIAHPIRLTGNYVTPNYFRTLGVQPILGRAFREEDAQPGQANVFLLSYAFWQEEFGGDPGVLNRPIRFSNQSFTIIGVMPKGFREDPGGGPRVFAPLVQANVDPMRRGLMHIVGRLKEDVTLEQAQVEMNILAEQMALSNPAIWDGIGTRVIPMLDYQVRGISSPLYMLLGAVGFLLLIACVNVANLLLARASTRQREIAVRTALGASRARIMRQLLAESLLLALIGGVGGIVLAYAIMPLLLDFAPVAMPRLDEVRIDGVALFFSCTITMLTGIAFGLVPALQTSKVDLTTSIKEGSRSAGSGRQSTRLRHALVVAEVTLAMILLAGAGLLTRSFAKLQDTDLGFNPHQLYASRIQLEPHRYPDAQQQRAFVDQALEQLAAQPDIEAAAFTTSLPFYRVFEAGLDVEAQPQDPDNLPQVGGFSITPDYFTTTQTALFQGRIFNDRDREDTPRVAIISRRLAEQYFPDRSPLGQRIAMTFDSTRDWLEIVGVVNDVKPQGAASTSPPQVYVPLRQSFIPLRILFVVRGREGGPNPAAQVAAALHAVDSDMAVARELVSLSVYADNAVSLHRFCLFLFTVFSTVALLLAALGIYGVTAYTVSQRTNEIGVRMALGAQPGDIFRLILHRAAFLVGIGMLIGIIGALAGARLLRSILHEVSPQDPLTFVAISATLALVALTACFLPARRAAKVNPMIALRSE